MEPQLIDAARHALAPTFLGCRDKAIDEFLQSGLLQQELNKSADFREAWTTHKKCNKVIPGKLTEHSTALTVFNNEIEPFFTDFTKAVKKLSVNATTYKDQFHFKSFYFLLMDLMTKVQPNQCRTGFMLTKDDLKNGSSVRFDSFAKAEGEIGLLADLEGETVLQITSCFYVGTNSCRVADQLILSPAEVFTVENKTSVKDTDNGDYTLIVLNHRSVETSQDCSMFSR